MYLQAAGEEDGRATMIEKIFKLGAATKETSCDFKTFTSPVVSETLASLLEPHFFRACMSMNNSPVFPEMCDMMRGLRPVAGLTESLDASENAFNRRPLLFDYDNAAMTARWVHVFIDRPAIFCQEQAIMFACGSN
jgi:hypothetical protein